MQNNRDSRKPARDTGESRLRRSVQQLKVFGVADAAHRPLLAELIDAPNINCLGIQAPSAESVRKAVSLPIDALVLFSSSLDGRTQSFMQEYQNSRQGVASILITDQDITVELMQLAMSCGINSVIPAIGGKELICSVIDEETNKILTRSETAEIRQYDSRVILVYSSKGGAGKTTLAVNLAASLKLRGKKVTVVDLDLASGDVHSFLNLENNESIGELAAEEQLTPAVIKSYIVPSQSGVDVLCAPSSPQYAANVRPEHILAILMTLRAENDYVVIDCDQQLAQGSIADCNMQAMNEADLILFVVNPEIPTINGASVMLNKYLTKVPGLTEKTRLVVNKTGSDSPITPAEIARTLDRKLYMAIPYDYKTVVTTLNNGVPFMLEGKSGSPAFLKKKIKKAFEELTEKILEEN